MSNQIQLALDQRMAWAQRHPALCVAPYTTLDVRRSDSSKAEIFQTCCCNLDDKIFEPSPGDDPFAEIKQQQAQGQWPKACDRCRWEENNGGQSERVRSFVQMPEQRLGHFIRSKQVAEFELRIKFSNFCNLSCRSCNPRESSTYAKITNRTAESTLALETDISYSEPHWQFITDSIVKHLPRVEHFFVHFIGGETLVQPGMQRLLEWMIAKNLAPKINLRLTTALSVYPRDELLSMLAEFKSVDILLSIDSVGKNYDYIRWPAKFEKIQRNLDALVGYQPQLTILRGRKFLNPKWKCSLSPVFSLNNIMYMDQWLDYWHQWYEQHGYVFLNYAANLVAETEHLDVQALPVEYRSELSQYLERCRQHKIFEQYPEHMRGIYNFITTTLTELNHWPDRPELWQKFLSLTAFFDIRTKLDFAIYNERLYNMLTQCDQQTFAELKQRIDTNRSLTEIMQIYNVQS